MFYFDWMTYCFVDEVECLLGWVSWGRLGVQLLGIAALVVRSLQLLFC